MIATRLRSPDEIGRFSDEERARASAFARRRYGRFIWRQAIYALVFIGVYASGLSRTMSTEASDTQAVWNIAAVCLAIGWAGTLPVRSSAPGTNARRACHMDGAVCRCDR